MGKQFYFFIGTTAELIKVAPILGELKKRNVEYKLITSGQNYIAFEELEPLIGKQTVYHAFKHKAIKISGAIYLNFFIWFFLSLYTYIPYFNKEFKNKDKKNIAFIVLGDTITSFLGAIIGKLFSLKLVHIESGYRSFNLLEPFPEEICRQGISYLADIHFCPDEWCLNNIKNHNGLKINTYLNTAYESVMKALSIKSTKSTLDLSGKFFILILHRQEHMLFQKGLTKKYIQALASLAKPELKCVFILHHVTENFLIKEGLFEEIKKNSNIIITPRLPYIEFQKTLSDAEFIATDGGGNQQESYFLGKPCLLLRKNVEGTEGLNSNAILAKDDIETVKNFIKNYKYRNKKMIKSKKLPSIIIVDQLLS